MSKNSTASKRELSISKEDLLEHLKVTDNFVDQLMVLYDQTAKRINYSITASIKRYADKNDLSYQDAKQMLNAKEHTTWRKGIKQFLREINVQDADPKILLELNTLSQKSRISREEEILSNIYKEMANLASESTYRLQEHLKDTIVENYFRGAYKIQKQLGIGFSVSRINTKLVQQIIEYPWSTKKFSKTIWENTDILCQTLKKELASALIDGRGVNKIVRDIDGCLGKGKYVTERVVRTEAKYFANQSQLLSFQKMGVKQYRFIGGGCPKCAILVNQIFNLDEAIVGVNFPPIHPNCKCTIIAVVAMSIFDNKKDVVPLDKNIKFIEWKKKFGKEA